MTYVESSQLQCGPQPTDNIQSASGQWMVSDHKNGRLEKPRGPQDAEKLDLSLAWSVDRIGLATKFPGLFLLDKTAKRIRPPPRIGMGFIEGKKMNVKACLPQLFYCVEMVGRLVTVGHLAFHTIERIIVGYQDFDTAA